MSAGALPSSPALRNNPRKQIKPSDSQGQGENPSHRTHLQTNDWPFGMLSCRTRPFATRRLFAKKKFPFENAREKFTALVNSPLLLEALLFREKNILRMDAAVDPVAEDEKTKGKRKEEA